MSRMNFRTIFNNTYIRGLLFFVALALGSLLLGWLLTSHNWLNRLDSQGYEWIRLSRHYRLIDWLIWPFNNNFIPILPLIPTFLYFMAVPPLVWVWFSNRKLFWPLVFAVITGIVLSHIVSGLDWHIIHRARPFDSLPNNLDESSKRVWQSLPSYPSGHTRDTALYATLLGFVAPVLRFPLTLLVVFVVFSRVYIGAHFPFDAIIGALVGYLTIKIILYVFQGAGLIKSGR